MQCNGGSLYFLTKLKPEGPKKLFLRPPPPYLRVWMTAPHLLIWWSGSATAVYLNIDCKGLIFLKTHQHAIVVPFHEQYSTNTTWFMSVKCPKNLNVRLKTIKVERKKQLYTPWREVKFPDVSLIMPLSLVGRPTLDLIWTSWVWIPRRSNDFSFALSRVVPLFSS